MKIVTGKKIEAELDEAGEPPHPVQRRHREDSRAHHRRRPQERRSRTEEIRGEVRRPCGPAACGLAAGNARRVRRCNPGVPASAGIGGGEYPASSPNGRSRQPFTREMQPGVTRRAGDPSARFGRLLRPRRPLSAALYLINDGHSGAGRGCPEYQRRFSAAGPRDARCGSAARSEDVLPDRRRAGCRGAWRTGRKRSSR